MKRLHYILPVAAAATALFIGVSSPRLHHNPYPINPVASPSAQLVSPHGARCVSTSGLPDTRCTPGATNSAVTQDTISSTICVSGYTKTIRPPVSVTNGIKKQTMAAYGYTDSMANYELDHLISLELGGSPDSVSNLWPEPYNIPNGAHQKDQIENLLHQRICSGQITVQEAQREISQNWEAVK